MTQHRESTTARPNPLAWRLVLLLTFFLSCACDARGMRNGSSAGTGTYAHTVADTDAPLELSRDAAGAPHWYAGLIDEVRISGEETLVEISGRVGEESSSYDVMDRVVRTDTGDGGVTYLYDAAGAVSAELSGGTATTYARDALGRLVRATVSKVTAVASPVVIRASSRTSPRRPPSASSHRRSVRWWTGSDPADAAKARRSPVRRG